MRSLYSGEEKNGTFFNNTIDYIYSLLSISEEELTELTMIVGLIAISPTIYFQFFKKV